MYAYFKFLKQWCNDEQQQIIAEELGVRKNTISLCFLDLREIIQTRLSFNTLGGYDEHGNNIVVEIDESFFLEENTTEVKTGILSGYLVPLKEPLIIVYWCLYLTDGHLH